MIKEMLACLCAFSACEQCSLLKGVAYGAYSVQVSQPLQASPPLLFFLLHPQPNTHSPEEGKP